MEETELIEQKEDELAQFKSLKAQIKERADRDQAYRDQLDSQLNKEKSKLDNNYENRNNLNKG